MDVIETWLGVLTITPPTMRIILTSGLGFAIMSFQADT